MPAFEHCDSVEVSNELVVSEPHPRVAGFETELVLRLLPDHIE